MQKKADAGIKNGDVITGKWQRTSYTIIRLIGSGMIGTVYLCRHQGKLYALKLGKHPTALVREVSMLKTFNKVRGGRLGPFLFDVDDIAFASGATYPFYVMEYIQGVRLSSYLKQHGAKSLPKLLLPLLKQLDKLHQLGYVYGDLKNENLLVSMNRRTPEVRLIDVGGVTKMGQSVKEYSNFFDRGYWTLGTRKAEASYDLFALVMVFLAVYYPEQFRRGRHPREQLARAVRDVPALTAYKSSFQKALDGAYPSAKTMRRDIEIATYKRQVMMAKHDEPLLSQAIILLLISLSCCLLIFFI